MHHWWRSLKLLALVTLLKGDFGRSEAKVNFT